MIRLSPNKWVEIVEYAGVYADSRTGFWEYCVLEGERIWVLFRDGSVHFYHNHIRPIYSSSEISSDYHLLQYEAERQWKEDAYDKREAVKKEIDSQLVECLFYT